MWQQFEQACCELCEQGGHSKEDCPLVAAAQESDPTPEAKEAGWQTVAGKAGKALAESKGTNKSSKAGKSAKGRYGYKNDNGAKEQRKQEKSGDAKKVITVHRDCSNGWVPAKRPLGSTDGSGSNQLGST